MFLFLIFYKYFPRYSFIHFKRRCLINVFYLFFKTKTKFKQEGHGGRPGSLTWYTLLDGSLYFYILMLKSVIKVHSVCNFLYTNFIFLKNICKCLHSNVKWQKSKLFAYKFFPWDMFNIIFEKDYEDYELILNI
jgi:hypothetical protein